MNTDAENLSSAQDGEIPERYIRTFAGDMETLKKGGEPDLTPLEKSPFATGTGAVEGGTSETVLSEVPEVKSEALPIPKVPLPEIIPKPALESATVLPPSPPEPPKLTPIKTYTDDFSRRLKETHASLATVLAAEQDTARQTPQLESSSEPQKGNRWYIVAGVFLLIVGGSGVYFAYSRYVASTAPVVVAPFVSSPIFVDSRESVSGTGLSLLRAFEQSVGKPLPINTVRLVAFDVSATTNVSVFAALDLRVPDILLRNINTTGSMAGVVNTGGGQSPFFILSVGSYSVTFSSMLSWEVSMLNDLGALFPAYLVPASTPASATTSLTASVTPDKISSNGSFHDEVVSNHDVRIYRDKAGRSIILYGYWNQSTLIIAREPAAFTEILGRLATPHS